MTNQNCVLILAQNHDPHAVAVIDKLRQRNCPFFLFNRHDDRYRLSYSVIGGKAKFVLRSPDQQQALSAPIGAIWWRVKPTRPVEFAGPDTTSSEAFQWAEWRHFLNSLYLLLDHCAWINNPHSQQRASFKPFNLTMAYKHELDVPDTVFSNDCEIARLDLSNHKDLIYKSLSGHLIHPDKFVYTTQLSNATLTANELAIAAAPCIFQPEITKLYELRVTIVGERVFVVKIDSQKSRYGKLDWRIEQDDRLLEKSELSTTTLIRLQALHAALGLDCATYDFIVTPEGREVFLECNPAGQWLWLDEALSLGITDAFCDLLISRCDSLPPL